MKVRDQSSLSLLILERWPWYSFNLKSKHRSIEKLVRQRYIHWLHKGSEGEEFGGYVPLVDLRIIWCVIVIQTGRHILWEYTLRKFPSCLCTFSSSNPLHRSIMEVPFKPRNRKPAHLSEYVVFYFHKSKTAEQNNTPAINLNHFRRFHFPLCESIHILNSTRCFTAPERAVSWLWLIFLFLVWPYSVVRFWHTGGCITHSTTLQHWLNFPTVCSGEYHFSVSELLFPHLESKTDSVLCLPQDWKSWKKEWKLPWIVAMAFTGLFWMIR